VELLARTYLQRKRKVINRHDLAVVRFPDLIRILQENASDLLSPADMENVLFFHEIRNLLYHGTDALTVRHDDVENYLSLAILLFRKLFDVGMDFGIESVGDTRLLLESESALQYYRRVLGSEQISGLSQHILFPPPLCIKVRQDAVDDNLPLEVDRLSYVFPQTGIFLVKDLSFDLKPRGALIVRGRSGVGKTTFLRLLTGELEQGSGEIKIFGAVKHCFYRLGSLEMTRHGISIASMGSCASIFLNHATLSTYGQGSSIFQSVRNDLSLFWASYLYNHSY